MPKIYATIANNISNRRRELGLHQTQLAKAAGLTRVTISNIECGRLRASWKTLETIAEALTTTVDCLCSEESGTNHSLNQNIMSSLRHAVTMIEQELVDIPPDLLNKFKIASETDRAIIQDILNKTEERMTRLGLDRNTPIKFFCAKDSQREGLKKIADQIQLHFDEAKSLKVGI